ncbi:hypothetical protein PAXINDRAFT_13667 [Paxillus involutus ATCC 200175]|uniref:Uncharacterized protein n=1 Tax=Paxillus involutus ATCC 200175 TaxID=664439 RepID=A0A0C9TTG8_PAXIN|nr:hypothetical protein PAXINDRAFT_13667 [Paxillus involutus ATCC 200175]
MSTECQAGSSSLGNGHTEDDCDAAVQFARDMESARQLSLQDVETAWNPRPSSLLHPRHLFSPSSSPPSSPCATPDVQPLLITSDHKSKGKGRALAPPKITTQMNATWAAEYKISAIQVSTKAKLDQEHLTAQLSSQRCIDLVYWDQDDHLLNDLALQWTDDNQSDIPHWPDFALTHVPTLLPALGEDVMAVEWFNLKFLVWKTITRLTYVFRVKNGDLLLLRRKGVVHCHDFETITQRLNNPQAAKQQPVCAFRDIKQERQRVSVSNRASSSPTKYLDIHSDREDTDGVVASPSPPSRKRGRDNDRDTSESIHSQRPYKKSNYPTTAAADYSFHHRRIPSAASSGSSLSSQLMPNCSVPSSSSFSYGTPISSPLLTPLLLPAVAQHSPNKRANIWPKGEYVSVIVAGMEAMDSSELKNLSAKQRFEAVFGRAYVKSTFNDACRRWHLAPHTL